MFAMVIPTIEMGSLAQAGIDERTMTAIHGNLNIEQRDLLTRAENSVLLHLLGYLPE